MPSSITYYTGSGWMFWPYSEPYQLTPKWSEWHAPTGDTVLTDEEPNRLDLVGDYDGADVYFTIALADDAGAVPAPVTIESRVWKTVGFRDERTLTVTEVLDDDDEWDGSLKVGLSSSLRQWMGVGQVHRFIVDVHETDDSSTKTRASFGTIVLRT